MTRVPSSILLSVFFLAAAFFVHAESEVQELSLADVRTLALERNPELRRLEAEQATTLRNAANTLGNVLPSIQLEASAIPLADSAQTGDSNIHVGIKSTLRLSADTVLADSAESLQADVARLTLDRQKQLVINKVTILYYSVLLSEKKIQVYESFLRSATTRLSREDALLGKGLGSILARLTAEESVLKKATAINLERNAREKILRELVEVTGLPEDMTVRLTDSLDSSVALSLPLRSGSYESRPDIQSARIQVRLAVLETERAKWQNRGPSLSLAAGYTLGLGSSVSGSPVLSLGLLVPVDSWIPGSAGDMAISAEKDTLATRTIELENATRTAGREIADAADGLKDARVRLADQSAIVKVALERYTIRSRLYESGTIDATSFSDDEDSYLQTELDAAQSAFDVFIADAELVYASGSVQTR